LRGSPEQRLRRNVEKRVHILFALEKEVETDCRNYKILLARAPEERKDLPMKQPSQNRIRPLFRLPPLAPLPIFFILGHSLLRNLQIDDSEQKLTPRNQRLCRLLLRTEIDNNRRLVRLQYQVQHCGNLLILRLRTSRLQHIRCDPNKTRKELPYNSLHHICFLPKPKRTDGFKRSDTSCVDLSNVTACKKRLDLWNQTGPFLIWEIVADDDFECIGELEGYCSRGGRGDETKEGRAKRIAVRCWDGVSVWASLGSWSGFDGVVCVYSVFDPNSAGLTSGSKREKKMRLFVGITRQTRTSR